MFGTLAEEVMSTGRDPGYDFEELERIPLTRERIIDVVSRAWLTLGLSCGPFAAMVYFAPTLRQLPQPVFFLIFIGSITWGAVVLFLYSKRLPRFLIATKNDSDPALTFEERLEKTRDRRSLREVIRDDGVFMFMAAGLIPGVMLAQAIGLKDQALVTFVASVTAILIAAICESIKERFMK